MASLKSGSHFSLTGFFKSAGVVFITGGGSGIGQASACLFCASGCSKFALVDLAVEGLGETAKKLNALNPQVQVLCIPTDVSDEEQVIACVRKAVEHFGRIDYAVQSAGVNQRPRALLHETEMRNYDVVLNINLRGLYMIQRELVRAMRVQEARNTGHANAPRKGSIVNIASISGIQPTPNLSPVSPVEGRHVFRADKLREAFSKYAASKAGVIAITKGDAQAYAREGIRINCICPGVVLTPMNLSSQAAGQDFSEFTNATPVGRSADPNEIAWSALFLSHPHSSYIVGHALVVDGGNTL